MQGIALGLFLAVCGLVAYTDFKDHTHLALLLFGIFLFGSLWAVTSIALIAGG